MSKLRHIYRSNKLSNIAQKRYTRKYSREYLEEKAARGASIKLGFGDFDGDGDLDGLYPKQRAGVAEKPGLHVYPPRGTLRKLKGAASPTFGPENVQALTIRPEAGPNSLTSSIVKPAEGPNSVTSFIATPALGPSSINAVNAIPTSGPSSVTSSIVKPALGPASITSSVIVPQAGPISLGFVSTPPEVGPSSLSSTVVVPGDGPRQVSAITNPLRGVSNLNANIAVPHAGPESLNIEVEKPVLGVTDLQHEIVLELKPIYKLSSAQWVELTGYPENWFIKSYYSFDFSFDNSRWYAEQYHSVYPAVIALDFFRVDSAQHWSLTEHYDQLVTWINNSGLPNGTQLREQYQTPEAVQQYLETSGITDDDIVGYWDVEIPFRGLSVWNLSAEQLAEFNWVDDSGAVKTVVPGNYSFVTNRIATGGDRIGDSFTQLLPVVQDENESWGIEDDAPANRNANVFQPLHEWGAILDKLAEVGVRPSDAVGYYKVREVSPPLEISDP